MVKSTTDRITILNKIIDAVENDFSEQDLKNDRVKWIDMSVKTIGVEKLADDYIIRFTIEREKKINE